MHVETLQLASERSRWWKEIMLIWEKMDENIQLMFIHQNTHVQTIMDKRLVYPLVDWGSGDKKMMKHLNSETHAVF